MLRLGFLTLSEGEFPVIQLTNEGMEALRSRSPITLTKPMELPKARRTTRREGEIACDEILFERLRTLRKRLADERKVPAYVVFGDTTLRQMARSYPTSLAAMQGITGMGEKKRAEFGATFAAAIAEHVAAQGRQAFND
jgi:ATP-dependent DNA helicase RecQ